MCRLRTDRRVYVQEADFIDLNWSDFTINMTSMLIVYTYFSKAALPHESITAVVLCIAVAAFDIFLLLMRCFWCAPRGVSAAVMTFKSLNEMCIQRICLEYQPSF
jgi:hypothetical protein